MNSALNYQLPSAWRLYQTLDRRHNPEFLAELRDWVEAEEALTGRVFMGALPRLLDYPEGVAIIIMTHCSKRLTDKRTKSWRSFISSKPYTILE